MTTNFTQITIFFKPDHFDLSNLLSLYVTTIIFVSDWEKIPWFLSQQPTTNTDVGNLDEKRLLSLLLYIVNWYKDE